MDQTQNIKRSERIQSLQKTISRLQHEHDELQDSLENIEEDLYNIPTTRQHTEERLKLKEQISQANEQISLIKEYINIAEKRLSQYTTSNQKIKEEDNHSDYSILANNLTTKVPSNLPKFRMGHGSLYEPESFLDSFRRILVANGMSVDDNWSRLLPICLNSQIAEWASTFLPCSLTYDQMYDAFILQYGDPQRIQKYTRQLFNLRRESHETISDFCSRFQLLAHKAKIRDDESGITRLLISALPDILQWQITGAIENGRLPVLSISSVIQYALSLPITRENQFHHNSHSSSYKNYASTPSTEKHQSYCSLHKTSGHNDSECRSQKGTLTQSNPSTKIKNSHSQQKQNSSHIVTCYKCHRTNHYANECPDLKLKNTRNEQLKQTHVVKTITQQHDDKTSNLQPELKHTQIADSKLELNTQNLKPYTVPILVNNTKQLAFIDTGASVTFISKILVDELNIKTSPVEGRIVAADPSVDMPRLGVTELIHIVCGKLDVRHSCEIVSDTRGPPILIGQDLIPAMKINIFGLPYEYVTNNDPKTPIVEDQIPELMSNDFSKIENSDSFKTLRENILTSIKSHLEANGTIPADAYCPLPESEIYLETPPGKTVYRRQYPIPFKMIQPMDNAIQEWLTDKIIERAPVDTTFNTPIFPIPKKDSEGNKTLCRLCLDYRPLNALLPDDSFPLPRISDIFETLSDSKIFTILDLKSAFHRFIIHPGHRYKTAFTWHNTQYVFVRAPFGLKTLPSKFQRVMQILINDLPFVRAYIDDLIIFSDSYESHSAHIIQVLQRLTDNNLVLNIEKCHFARLQLMLLGFTITPYGRSIDKSRLVNINDWPSPTTGRQLQHYLGFINYFRNHVPLISTLTATLDALRCKNDIRSLWTPAHQETFDKLKTIIPICPPLAFPNFNVAFIVATDASNVGIGAVLYQIHPETKAHNWISFQARSLSTTERNYSATKRELLAVIYALNKFHHYIWGTHFTLYTDHVALTYLHTQKQLNPMLVGWYETIFDYDFAIFHRPGIQNILPDHLSRFFSICNLEGEQSLQSSQPSITLQLTNVESIEDILPLYTIPDVEQRYEILQNQHLLGHFGANSMG
jgi:hypothetical protein